MKAHLLKNSALIFLGGCCYGAIGSVIKKAYAAGYTPGEVVFIQMFFAWIIFALIGLVRRIRRGEMYWPCIKDLRALLIAGLATCLTSLFYALSLSRLPASVSITLLFQFTWLGIALEAVLSRKNPGIFKILAGIVIFCGTLAASGLLGSLMGEGGLGKLDPLGIVFGLLSACCSTTYLYLTGHAATRLHVSQRAFFIALGASLTALIYEPQSILLFFSGDLEVLKLASFLGIFAIVLPVYLFASAAPWLPSGLVTIMASSELPASVTCAVLLLGEELDPLRILGILVILLGVALSQVSLFFSDKNEASPAGI